MLKPLKVHKYSQFVIVDHNSRYETCKYHSMSILRHSKTYFFSQKKYSLLHNLKIVQLLLFTLCLKVYIYLLQKCYILALKHSQCFNFYVFLFFSFSWKTKSVIIVNNNIDVLKSNIC